MRAHELWCAAQYRGVDGVPYACDCGAEKETAQHLAPYAPGGLKKDERQRKHTTWAGKLPDQFCVRCESGPVKKVIITPKAKTQPTRVFAACLNPECAHIREISVAD